jgi:hypothetical protein
MSPSEVVMEAIAARMVERNDVAGGRIARFDLVICVVVAALAREREVVGRRLPATRSGDHVLHREGLARDARRAPAIFAASTRAITDQPPKRGRNAPAR